MSVLHFVFSSFWTFAGTVVLIAFTGEALARIVVAFAAVGAAWSRRTGGGDG